MLPPSLRLLVRQQARSVPLQLRRLTSRNAGSHAFADLLLLGKGSAWGSEGKSRAKRSQPPSGARGGRSSKKRKTKKTKGQDSSRPLYGMTREQRILETVRATVPNKRPLAPAKNDIDGWQPEDWKTDSWGLDSKSRVLIFCTIGQAIHNASEQNSSLSPPIKNLSLK